MILVIDVSFIVALLGIIPVHTLAKGYFAYNQYSIIFPLYSLDFKQSLDVHHKVYRKKNGQIIEPWEYDDKDLETLCHSCHLKSINSQSMSLMNSFMELEIPLNFSIFVIIFRIVTRIPN